MKSKEYSFKYRFSLEFKDSVPADDDEEAYDRAESYARHVAAGYPGADLDSLDVELGDWEPIGGYDDETL